MATFSRAALAALFATATLAGPATAAGVDAARDLLLARGHVIAEAHCSVCHAVGPTGDSPARANLDTPFHRLYERYPIEMLVEAASTGRISGHDEMPGFEFPLEDIHALLAYIDSLAPDKPGYANPPAK